MTDSGVQVALFRGINVGKSTRIAMKDLKDLFIEAGCTDVTSYVQSGNVVFRAAPDVSATLPEILEAQVRERFGVKTWIVTRSMEEMRETVANNPFADLNAPPTSVAVAFRRDTSTPPTFAHTANLDDIPDRVEVRGADIYLYLPDGFSKSKLDPKFFAKDLGTTTTRNWRTVTRLLDMMESIT